MKQCNCIEQITKMLVEKHGEVDPTINQDIVGRVVIYYTVAPKGRSKTRKEKYIIPGFCPFCGNSYE